jgi:hypothetical protein
VKLISEQDIEEDLTQTGALVLPRIMMRLLIVLTQDRKITYVAVWLMSCVSLIQSLYRLHNWQLALRRQHARRDPASDPLAPIPALTPSRSPSPASDRTSSHPPDSLLNTDTNTRKEMEDTSSNDPPDSLKEPKARRETVDVNTEGTSPSEDHRPQDWVNLPMLEKLDSLHLLTEWQFHNVSRFRTTMRSDDETAEWVSELPSSVSRGFNTHFFLFTENRANWI